MQKYKKKILLGSFAYRYAIGFNGFESKNKMSLLEFLKESHNLGFDGVQLCENLRISELSDEQLEIIKNYSKNLGLIIEIGLSNLTEANLLKHIHIANVVSSKFIRIVVGKEFHNGVNKISDIIKNNLKSLKEKNIIIGIENHFDFTTKELIELVKNVDDENVGLIFDSTNSLAFVEEPEVTYEKMKPYLVSAHIKDYDIKKIEAGYLISGTELGKGKLFIKKILNDILTIKKSISIVMEMTIRRDLNMKNKDVIDWEEKEILNSKNYLMNLYEEYKEKEYE